MDNGPGTPLFAAFEETWRDDPETLALMVKVWEGTPWMVNAHTGSVQDSVEIRQWCRDRFGDEAWPIHGKPGDWQFGGVTIHGWTWVGFATEPMLDEFCNTWETKQGVPA